MNGEQPCLVPCQKLVYVVLINPVGITHIVLYKLFQVHNINDVTQPERFFMQKKIDSATIERVLSGRWKKGEGDSGFSGSKRGEIKKIQYSDV